MKLKLDIDPDIVAMMAAEVAAGQRGAVPSNSQNQGGICKGIQRRIPTRDLPVAGVASLVCWWISGSSTPRAIRMAGTRAELLSRSVIVRNHRFMT